MYDSKELKALGSYKNELYKMIVNDELSDALINILMPTLDEPRLDKIDNFLGGEYKIAGEVVDLAGRIYDVPFVYCCVTDCVNVLCMDTNITRSERSIKEMSVTIYIMCHKDNLRLDSATKSTYRRLGYVGNRLDIATAILGDIISHSRKFGIGELGLDSYNPVKSYFSNNDFFGKVVVFKCNDFLKDFGKEGANS